jgi:secernin
MCDTFVALRNSTLDGSVIFGKNSDRDPNEAHHLLLLPAAEHPDGAEMKLTYIHIPQVKHTHAVLLAKPFWIWGAEMGANEHGVVIGNEAVFTKVPYDKQPGMIGMDLLRLGLERATTAEAAMKVIIELLEQYGQGGNCGFSHKIFYHNSFLIADRSDAWVLETAGKHWAAEKVKDVRSISNAITIGNTYDAASADLVKYAVERGWCKGQKDFDFARCYSDFLFTTFADGRNRQSCTSQKLQELKGKVTLQAAMGLLRSHTGDSKANWSPDGALHGADVCMHAGFGPVRVSQTTGSMIAHLAHGVDTYWVNGTAAPCTSVFKPVWIEAGLPKDGTAPQGVYDPQSSWWQHELLHREVLRNYSLRLKAYQKDRDALEAGFIEAAHGADNTHERGEVSVKCFQQAEEALPRWLGAVREVTEKPRAFYYNSAWRKTDKEAKLPK